MGMEKNYQIEKELVLSRCYLWSERGQWPVLVRIFLEGFIIC